LTVVQALILALVFASPLAAQNVDFNSDVNLDSLPPAPSESTSTSSPKKPEKVSDKKLFAVMGALGGAESLRFTSRKLVLEHEYAAGAPWVSSVPHNQHIIAKDLLLYSTEFLVAYELKKSHSWLPGDHIVRKLWWVYPAVMTVIHIKNGVENIRTQGPGGCTTLECAMQMQTH
jgi:hypothetical protein